MEYLAGLGTGLVLFLCVYLGYRLGQRHDKPKLSETEKYKLEQQKKELEEIMTYNLDKAIRGGGKG